MFRFSADVRLGMEGFSCNSPCAYDQVCDTSLLLGFEVIHMVEGLPTALPPKAESTCTRQRQVAFLVGCIWGFPENYRVSFLGVPLNYNPVEGTAHDHGMTCIQFFGFDNARTVAP